MACHSCGIVGYSAESLARIASQNWKVELDRDVRNAILTPRGVPFTWTPPEPVGRRLNR